jgi:hypothetical protein
MDAFHHPSPVCTCPIHAATLRAASESRLSPVDIGGYQISDFRLGNRLKIAIALKTASQYQSLVHGVARKSKDLLQLMSQIFISNQDASLERAALREPSVTGEGDTVIDTATTDQFVIVNLVVVPGVVSEYSQPTGKAPKHDVGSESVTA